MGRRKYFTCLECGGVMEFGDEEVLVCTSCGYSVEASYYNNWKLDKEMEEYKEDEDDVYGSMPECCKACGGPYPSCTTSCKIFDD